MFGTLFFSRFCLLNVMAAPQRASRGPPIPPAHLAQLRAITQDRLFVLYGLGVLPRRKLESYRDKEDRGISVSDNPKGSLLLTALLSFSTY